MLFVKISFKILLKYQSKTCHLRSGYKVSIGDKAPDLELNMIDGTRMNLSELLGQVVVLQFTASWCSVCIQEMPHLEKEVWLPFKDEGLMLIGIDRDEPLKVEV